MATQTERTVLGLKFFAAIALGYFWLDARKKGQRCRTAVAKLKTQQGYDLADSTKAAEDYCGSPGIGQDTYSPEDP